MKYTLVTEVWSGTGGEPRRTFAEFDAETDVGALRRATTLAKTHRGAEYANLYRGDTREGEEIAIRDLSVRGDRYGRHTKNSKAAPWERSRRFVEGK